jgi:hypothetical protein
VHESFICNTNTKVFDDLFKDRVYNIYAFLMIFEKELINPWLDELDFPKKSEWRKGGS